MPTDPNNFPMPASNSIFTPPQRITKEHGHADEGKHTIQEPVTVSAELTHMEKCQKMGCMERISSKPHPAVAQAPVNQRNVPKLNPHLLVPTPWLSYVHIQGIKHRTNASKASHLNTTSSFPARSELQTLLTVLFHLKEARWNGTDFLSCISCLCPRGSAL